MNEQYIDAIHRYLDGSMAGPEREAFEADLAGNPTLRGDVEFERLLLAGLVQAGEQTTRQTISSVHRQLQQEGFFESAKQQDAPPLSISFTNKQVLRRLLAVAATLVLIMAGIRFFNRPADKMDRLYSRFYQNQEETARARQLVPQLESHGMAGILTGRDSLGLALRHFADDELSTGRTILEKLHQSPSANDTVDYYLAVVYMGQKNYAQAAELLLPLSTSDRSAFRNDAAWNLGLCYLKSPGGTEKALDLFTRLADTPDYPNRQGAREILEELKK